MKVVHRGEHQQLLRFSEGMLTEAEVLPVRSRLQDRSSDVDLVVVLLRDDGEPMARYPLRASAILPPHSDAAEALQDLALIGDWAVLSEELMSVFSRWARKWPHDTGRWRRVRGEERAAWFQAVKAYNLSLRRRRHASAPGRFLQLQGSWIKDRQDFYLALGEAVNGPLGYLGGDLDGLDDCLSGGWGVQTPFTLIWDSSAESREALGDYYVKILEVFADNEVDVQEA